MIYFIHDKASKAIKIGYADKPHQRMRMLQCGCPNPLDLIAMTPGDRAEETKLHRRFKADRLRGEWFRATDELLAYARSLFEHAMAPFLELVRLEPRLMDLYNEAKSFQFTADPRFCANEVWYGGYSKKYPGLKPRMLDLVGWCRTDRDPVLGTMEAYDTALKAVYEALPDCRQGCACMTFLEACLT